MVIEMSFAPTKRRSKQVTTPAQSKPAKISAATSKNRPTIPASVVPSLLSNNAAKIREVEIDGVVFEVV
jgi:hypothetical protein